jgi:4-hydroxybenzoyl-CoA reductase subunit beta
MLRLSRFSYVAPNSVREAVDLISTEPEAVLMAGGTDVLINIKHRLVTPKMVVGIRQLPELHGLQTMPRGGMTIGAGITLRRLELDPAVQAAYPALSHAAHLISTPQVRACGTLGGNLGLDVRCNYYNQSYEWRKAIGFCMKKDSEICRVAPGGDRCWAVASADTVPVLVALQAEASVLGPRGERRIPVERLYQDDGLVPLTLQRGEIVTDVHLPAPGEYECVYQKFRIRHSFDFPLVGVAVAIRRAGDGTVEDARIVMTAVAAFPESAEKAERLLIGSRLDEESIQAAGQAVFRQAKPMDNTAGSIFHRKRMARVLCERSLREIAGLQEPIRNTA